MSGGIWVAAAGATAQVNELDNAANNLVNVNTVGYRRQESVFRSAMTDAMNRGRLQSGQMATVDTSSVNTQEGALQRTGRTLDAAIRGDGYFAVQTARGVRYTRAGAFDVGEDGSLQTRAGMPVLDSNLSPIRVPRDGRDFRIEPDGTILNGTSSVGKLGFFTFSSPGSLFADGGNVLRSTVPGTPAEAKLEPGALESSNVNIAQGLVSIVTASRSFEACQRAIEAFKTADSKAATVIMGKE